MYSGVPSTMPVWVSRGCSSASSLARSDFEIPKSTTLTKSWSLRRSRNRFSGLMSRWAVPVACAATSGGAARGGRGGGGGVAGGARGGGVSPRGAPHPQKGGAFVGGAEVVEVDDVLV